MELLFEDFKISENFMYHEFFVSETAEKHGLINYPPKEEEQLIKNNIILLTVNLLQPLRTLDGRAIVIDSGYRTPELNVLVGGVKNSQHKKALAVDIKRQDPKALAELLLSSRLAFDQCILYRNKPHLLHLGYQATGNRMQYFYK